MDAHQHGVTGGASEEGGSGKGSYLCRQSTTRWTPTTDQIRILKDLYYNGGVRSPSADQIQRISARLRQYGKIEGKNVFYWFQNYKARERQKKRYIVPNSSAAAAAAAAAPTAAADVSAPRQSAGGHAPVPRHAAWKADDSLSVQSKYPYSYTSPGFRCPSSSSSSICPNVVPPVGQMVGGFGYGAVAMEKNFRECSISAGGAAMGHNFRWAANSNPQSYYLFDKRSSTMVIDESLDHEDEFHIQHDDDHDDDEVPHELETLPLFPMHGEDSSDGGGFYDNNFRSSEAAAYYGASGGYHWSHGGGGGGSRTSLELSLNSFSRNSINF